jgi:hypothetical protein
MGTDVQPLTGRKDPERSGWTKAALNYTLPALRTSNAGSVCLVIAVFWCDRGFLRHKRLVRTW